MQVMRSTRQSGCTDECACFLSPAFTYITDHLLVNPVGNSYFHDHKSIVRPGKLERYFGFALAYLMFSM